MSRRICVTVQRGITDKTAVWVFPWELPLLQHIHGGDVQEISIDALCAVKDGVIKIEKQKMKHTKFAGPDLRAQFDAMAYVAPDDDPAQDPHGEYERLVMRYGMDKELPIPVVTRIYGEMTSGAFESKLKELGRERAPKPSHMKAAEEGLDKAPALMSVGELRDCLDERKIEWGAKLTKGQLRDLLEGSLVT